MKESCKKTQQKRRPFNCYAKEHWVHETLIQIVFVGWYKQLLSSTFQLLPSLSPSLSLSDMISICENINENKWKTISRFIRHISIQMSLKKTLKKGSVFVCSIRAHPTSVIPFWDIDFSLAYSNFLHNFL